MTKLSLRSLIYAESYAVSTDPFLSLMSSTHRMQLVHFFSLKTVSSSLLLRAIVCLSYLVSLMNYADKSLIVLLASSSCFLAFVVSTSCKSRRFASCLSWSSLTYSWIWSFWIVASFSRRLLVYSSWRRSSSEPRSFTSFLRFVSSPPVCIMPVRGPSPFSWIAYPVNRPENGLVRF